MGTGPEFGSLLVVELPCAGNTGFDGKGRYGAEAGLNGIVILGTGAVAFIGAVDGQYPGNLGGLYGR